MLSKKRLQNRKEILTGSITKTIFKLAWPVMVGNTMQVAYNLADTFWLGKDGANSVAALSVSFPLIFLMISIGGGITVAGTTIVAQYTGQGQSKMANKITGQIFIFVESLSILLALLGYFFNYEALKLIGAPQNIISDAAAYLKIISIGIPFMFAFFIFSALLRGYGDTKTPMKMMIFSTILNILLDPFLIFGLWIFPEMGVEGAALATIISRAFAGSIGIYILFVGKKGLKLKLKYLKPDYQQIKKILVLGIPSAAEQSIAALGMTFLMSIVAHFGTVVVAAYGIGSKILSAVMLPARGLAAATTTMVGQNIGAQNTARAERTAWTSSALILGIMTFLAAVFNIFPEFLISIFNSNPEVIKIGVSFLKIVGFSFGFLGVRFIIGGSFRGAGNTLIAMIIAIIALWGIRLPLAHLLGIHFDWGPQGIWWAMFLSNLITALIAAFWFKLGSWKKAVIN